MFTTLWPDSRLFAREFGPGGKIYTDHLGRSVLCDVEGKGAYRVEGDCEIEADGGPTGSSGTFCEGLIVAADGSNSVNVECLSGGFPTFEGGQEVHAISGCGWIVASNGPVQVDGLHETLRPVTGFPRPYFKGAVCEEGMTVTVADLGVELVDEFEVADETALRSRSWKIQNGSELFELSSRFADGTEHTGFHVSHLNAASWITEIPPENSGLLVRKLYDRFHGRQRSRVLVDGVHAGIWYEADESRDTRWAWGQFGVPKVHSCGKSSVTLTIDPPAGVPLWDVSRVEVYALIIQ